MSDDDRQRLVAEIDSALKGRAKADPRTIREIVESALEREFSTKATAAVERRIDEKKQRIQTLEREINERKRELSEERDELERLERELEQYDSHGNAELERAREQLSETPKDPENPAIQNWASQLGMTPRELVDRL